MALTARQLDRRTVLGGGAAAALGLILPGAFGRSAHAGDANAATPSHNDGVEGMRAMRLYSEENEAVGIFINLRANSDVSGDELGQAVVRYFASHDPPIAASYRVNQSQGKQTLFTFYVGGVPYPISADEIRSELATVTDRFRGYQSGAQTLSMK